jgi:hypothetical protein
MKSRPDLEAHVSREISVNDPELKIAGMLFLRSRCLAVSK